MVSTHRCSDSSDALQHRLVQLPLDLFGESLSRIPACAFTISPSAQNVTPSPYGSERPCRQYDEVRLRFDVREQLGDETALADPRDADDRHERRGVLLPRALERVDELVDLSLAADERRSAWRPLRC